MKKLSELSIGDSGVIDSILDSDMYAMVREIPADIQKNSIRLVSHSVGRFFDIARLVLATLKRVNIFFIVATKIMLVC